MDISKLISVLAEQSKVYLLLIDLSKEMQEVVKVNNIEGIDSLIKIQMALVMKLAAFERKRIEVVNFISQEANIDPNDLTITKIKRYLDETQYQSLEKLEAELHDNISSLARVNDTNLLLINNELDLIEFSLETLGVSENTMYDSSGKNQQKQIIDEKV